MEEGSVSEIVRVILWTSKGGIVKWNIDEVGGRITEGDCRCDCMYNQGC